MKRIAFMMLFALSLFGCDSDNDSNSEQNPSGTPGTQMGTECQPKCHYWGTAFYDWALDCPYGHKSDFSLKCNGSEGDKCGTIDGRDRCYEACLVEGEVDTREITLNDKCYKQTRKCTKTGDILYYADATSVLCGGGSGGDNSGGDNSGNGYIGEGSGNIEEGKTCGSAGCELCSGDTCVVGCEDSESCRECTKSTIGVCRDSSFTTRYACRGNDCSIKCEDASCSSVSCEGKDCPGINCKTAGCKICAGSSCLVGCDEKMQKYGCMFCTPDSHETPCSGIGTKYGCNGEDCVIKCKNAGCMAITCEGQDCPELNN